MSKIHFSNTYKILYGLTYALSKSFWAFYIGAILLCFSLIYFGFNVILAGLLSIWIAIIGKGIEEYFKVKYLFFQDQLRHANIALFKYQWYKRRLHNVINKIDNNIKCINKNGLTGDFYEKQKETLELYYKKGKYSERVFFYSKAYPTLLMNAYFVLLNFGEK